MGIKKMTGEWKSQQLTDEDGDKIKGKMGSDGISFFS